MYDEIILYFIEYIGYNAFYISTFSIVVNRDNILKF